MTRTGLRLYQSIDLRQACIVQVTDENMLPLRGGSDFYPGAPSARDVDCDATCEI